MHYLHPRSRSTSTLFTSTLALCFLVVGLPHLLPCPADRRQFADSFETQDGKIRRRRKQDRVPEGEEKLQEQELQKEVAVFEGADDSRPKRECPVPKPGGIFGQMMGFPNEERPKPSEVIIKSLDTKKSRGSLSQNNEGT